MELATRRCRHRPVSTLVVVLALLAAFSAGRVAVAAAAPAEDAPFENEIRAFEAADAKNPPAPGGVLFVGSSSIRLWTTLADDFPGLPVVNRGFGGSQVADSVRYAPRIVLPYNPKTIVLYAGDNDIAEGKSPEQVLADFKTFVETIRAELPETRILFISIKPSTARWRLIDKIRRANRLVRGFTTERERLGYIDIFTPMLGNDGKPRAELLGPDGLHLNEKGYALWRGVVAAALNAPDAKPKDRDTKVRDDRQAFEGSDEWIYNDLDAGVRAAREAGKPLFIVFRCIPCEACKQFDEDVAGRDPIVRDLMDRFVCVRIVQANTIDLARFQHDFDQSFAAYMTDADLTIYARYGTRSARPEHQDMSLEGLRATLEAALRLHQQPSNEKAALLAGKQVRGESPYKTPADYPSLAGKYQPALDYQGKVAQSCLHCHQVREAERQVYRSAREPIPDGVLFPYPDSSVLGLKMDARAMAEVERVEPDSLAEQAGLNAGDEILTLGGQALLSIADLQWVLHNAPASATLLAKVQRGGKLHDVSIDLPEGWRRQGDISWRATTWDLRRMGLGGMWLEDLTDEQRAAAGLSKDKMALRARHVGEYGEHATALRAGLRKGDVVVSFDGRTSRISESELLAYALQEKRPGDEVTVVVLRDGQRKTVGIALQ